MVFYTCISVKKKGNLKQKLYKQKAVLHASCDVINDEGLHPVLNCELWKALLTVQKLFEKSNL